MMTQRMASLLHIRVAGAADEIVFVVLHIAAHIVFDFGSCSDVFDIGLFDHAVLSGLGEVLFADHAAVGLRLLNINGIDTLSYALEHLRVILVDVDAAIQVLIHPCLHLSIDYALVFLDVGGGGGGGMRLQIIIKARWRIGTLFCRI